MATLSESLVDLDEYVKTMMTVGPAWFAPAAVAIQRQLAQEYGPPKKGFVIVGEDSLPTFVTIDSEVIRRDCGCCIAFGLRLGGKSERDAWPEDASAIFGSCAEHEEEMNRVHERYVRSLIENPQERLAVDVAREMLAEELKGEPLDG